MRIRYIDPREAFLNNTILTIAIIYWVFFIIWTCQLFRLGKRKDKTQMWLILILNLVTLYTLLPIWTIVGLCLGRDEENKEADNESEEQKSTSA